MIRFQMRGATVVSLSAEVPAKGAGSARPKKMSIMQEKGYTAATRPFWTGGEESRCVHTAARVLGCQEA